MTLKRTYQSGFVSFLNLLLAVCLIGMGFYFMMKYYAQQSQEAGEELQGFSDMENAIYSSPKAVLESAKRKIDHVQSQVMRSENKFLEIMGDYQ